MTNEGSSRHAHSHRQLDMDLTFVFVNDKLSPQLYVEGVNADITNTFSQASHHLNPILQKQARLIYFLSKITFKYEFESDLIELSAETLRSSNLSSQQMDSH